MPLKLVVYEPDAANMELCRMNFAQNKAWLDEMGAQWELLQAAALTNDAPQARFTRIRVHTTTTGTLPLTRW